MKRKGIKTASEARTMKERVLKILPPKQLLQRLPILLAQVKAVNISENLLKEIRSIVYSLYWERQTSKEAYNNLFKSI